MKNGNQQPIDFMSDLEADFIKDKCRKTGVWEEIREAHPKFHDYVERLPDSANSHELLLAPLELIETYQNARRWARDHMIMMARCWKCIMAMMD